MKLLRQDILSQYGFNTCLPTLLLAEKQDYSPHTAYYTICQAYAPSSSKDTFHSGAEATLG